MANNGHTDTDMGLNDILKEMEKIKSMCVKVGVTEDVGSKMVFEKKKGKKKITIERSATLAQIASWNELGVLEPPMSQNGGGKWFIPPRPFIRGWADGKREQIAKKIERIGKLVMDGKLTAEMAMARLGEYGTSGVKSYIRNGVFTPNADSTVARKGSSKPLIDTGILRNSIRHQVINKPPAEVSE